MRALGMVAAVLVVAGFAQGRTVTYDPPIQAGTGRLRATVTIRNLTDAPVALWGLTEQPGAPVTIDAGFARYWMEYDRYEDGTNWWSRGGDFDGFYELDPGKKLKIRAQRDLREWIGVDWNHDSLQPGFRWFDQVEADYPGSHPPHGTPTDAILLDEVWTKGVGAKKLTITLTAPGVTRLPGEGVPALHE